MAFFAPASGMNPDTLKLYETNRLAVIRQLAYSPKHENKIDVTLSVNGIPIVTAELKNQMTGQNYRHAMTQYRKDLIFTFKKRSLVHFAVDTDEVYMTTRLSGDKTYFLPFNKGNNGGAGTACARRSTSTSSSMSSSTIRRTRPTTAW